jgi:hypothetical protein
MSSSWSGDVQFSFEKLMPNGLLFRDPTIMCVVYAALYCGAVIAPPCMWANPALKDQNKATVIKNLKSTLYASLEHSQYRSAPTLSTLSALLLARSCAKKPSEPPLEDLFFFNMVVGMAHSMGLHREDAISKLDIIPRELSRRIYWHIRWLDIQCSLLNGSETFCGCSESMYDTKAPQAVAEDGITNRNGFSPETEDSSWIEGFVSKLFTVGRFEMARFQRSMLYIITELDQMERTKIVFLTDALEKFHAKMDALISQMPADGIPEKGMIPSRLANASPHTHEHLYTNDSLEPTVFSSWARITLSIFKGEAATTLYKALLGRPDFKSEADTWDM